MASDETGLVFRSFEDIERVAKHAAESGLTQHRKLAAAVTVLLTGRELGLPAMASLRSIHEVNGRPVLGADAMVACVRRSGLCASWRVTESTPERCTITTIRRGEEHAESVTWTLEDARRAGCGGPSWAKFPRQMLRHRAAAELARSVYPDVILGLYTPEELGGDDAVEESSSSAAVSAPAPVAAPAAVLEAEVEEPVQALEDGPVVDGVPFAEAVRCVDLPGKAVAVWLGYRAAIAPLSRAEAATRWNALVDRVAVCGRMAPKAASAWLKKALAEEAAREALLDPATATLRARSQHEAEVAS